MPAVVGVSGRTGNPVTVSIVVIILLALATVVLVRSMTKRIKWLPATLDRTAEQPSGRDAQDAGRESS